MLGPNVLAIGTILLHLLAGAGGWASPPMPAEGTWRLWNRPKQIPQKFSVTSLRDGRVLIAGGNRDPGEPAPPNEHAAEVLDPKTGIWGLTDPFPSHRVQHTAVPLSSGGVLLAGGLDHRKMEWPHFGRRRRWAPPPLSRDMLVSAAAWEPRRGWRPTGSMLDPRIGARGVLLLDGRVMIAGGMQFTFGISYIKPGFYNYGNEIFLASVEIWSPLTGRWKPASPMLQKRHGHTATTLADGRVLVVGGAPGKMVDGGLPVPAEVWDPFTGQWTVTARPHWHRLYHTATRLMDGRVLVTGGETPVEYRKQGQGIKLKSAEVWDPMLNTWTEVAPMAPTRFEHDAILLGDGRVLVVGGFGDASSSEIWNPATNRWVLTGPFVGMNIGNGGRLATLPDGRVLMISNETVQVWSPSSPKKE